MTITQALVLVSVIALWSTGNGIDLSNNTTLLIILLIALIALSFATTYRRNCLNNFQSTSTQNNNSILSNLFA